MFLKCYCVSYNTIHWFNLLMGISGIIFKNGPSKIWARQSLNNLKWYGLLRQTKPLQLFFKGCLLQILFGPFLNTLPICRWRRKCDKAEEKKKLWYINLWQFYYRQIASDVRRVIYMMCWICRRVSYIFSPVRSCTHLKLAKNILPADTNKSNLRKEFNIKYFCWHHQEETENHGKMFFSQL